jgi:seryl-tRNA synthetase
MDLKALPGYGWMENGQSTFSGKLLELYRRLDKLFLSWAAACGAAEYRYPTFIPARELAKIDYFRSFPHLVTFPVVLDVSEENLKRFTEGEPLDSNGEINLTRTAPIRDVLTPAACYHFYIHFQGERLEAPRYVTTRATCFRREAYYSPLERQWSFSMREIVCIGSAEEVKLFLKQYQERVDDFLKKIGLPVEWKQATDPFFNPSRNPKYLLQKLDPAKTEMVYRTGLAIGSINFHRNYFGEAFQISREGKEAFSGCVAFGVERWIYAFLNQFGADERDWPTLDSKEE